MNPFVHGWMLACGLAGMIVLAGCASRRPKAPSAMPPAPAMGEVDNSDLFPTEAEEQATEALARFATGIIHDMNQEPAEALKQFTRAAEADPTNEELVIDVARRFLGNREPEKALALLQKSALLPESSGMIYAWLGLVYDHLGRTADAITANRTAIRKMPGAILPYQNLAKLYLRDMPNGAAEFTQVLDEAARQPGLEAGFLIDLAELYSTLPPVKGQPDAGKRRILEMLNRAAAAETGNPRTIEKLADGFKLMGETQKALEGYLKLLEEYPDWPNLREKLAEIYLRSEDRKKAAEQLEAIIRNNPTKAEGYFYLGEIAQAEKNFDKAAENFERALLLSPNNLLLHFELATTYLAQERYTNALALMEKVRTKFPSSFELEFYTALTYQQAKKFDKAINHFTAAEVQAQATNPELLNYIFYFQSGSAYERNGDFEQAERHMKKCLELKPDFPDALNYLGYMWAEKGLNLDQAKTMIEKAVEKEPKNSAYLDSLAWVLFKLGQPKEALEHMLKALEHSDEPDPTLYDHLGDIYAELKEDAKSHEAWQKALAIEPNAAIKEKLEAAAAAARAAPK